MTIATHTIISPNTSRNAPPLARTTIIVIAKNAINETTNKLNRIIILPPFIIGLAIFVERKEKDFVKPSQKLWNCYLDLISTIQSLKGFLLQFSNHPPITLLG